MLLRRAKHLSLLDVIDLLTDRQSRDARAARGSWQAFQLVRDAVAVRDAIPALFDLLEQSLSHHCVPSWIIGGSATYTRIQMAMNLPRDF